jgi:hypothetical protein
LQKPNVVSWCLVVLTRIWSSRAEAGVQPYGMRAPGSTGLAPSHVAKKVGYNSVDTFACSSPHLCRNSTCLKCLALPTRLVLGSLYLAFSATRGTTILVHIYQTRNASQDTCITHQSGNGCWQLYRTLLFDATDLHVVADVAVLHVLFHRPFTHMLGARHCRFGWPHSGLQGNTRRNRTRMEETQMSGY